MLVELEFPLSGERLPSCHGYQLMAAICNVVPAAHEHAGLAIHTISGTPEGGGTILLREDAKLRLRGEHEELRQYLGLGGKTLSVNGYRLRVGVPAFRQVLPTADLAARIVDLKTTDEDEFCEILDARVRGSCDRWELGRRLVSRVKGRTIVGYGVILRDLVCPKAANDWLKHGIGTKRKFGFGIFEPIP